MAIEKNQQFCELCGATDRFRVCATCIKESASIYDSSKPFPDPENPLEQQVATFLLSNDLFLPFSESQLVFNKLRSLSVLLLHVQTLQINVFDERAATVAFFQYMRETFGGWYYQVNLTGITDEKEQQAARNQLIEQYVFLFRFQQFLKENQKHITANHIKKISTLVPINEKIDDELDAVLQRGDALVEATVTSLHLFSLIKLILELKVQTNSRSTVLEEPSTESAAD